MVFGASSKPKPAPKRTASSTSIQRPVRASSDNSFEGSVQQALDLQGPHAAPLTNAEREIVSDAPLIRLVNSLLTESVKRSASDIHIEPLENSLRIRFRIDGVLQEIQNVPMQLAPAIVSRLKIMANLDICEKRIPQDGSIKLRLMETEADFRLSTLPSCFGEKIVMRVMGTAAAGKEINSLGIPEQQLKQLRDAIQRPDGLVLVTGPTGSGKTTTLYAALRELNDPTTSVFTAEDPVEGTLAGVTQCQVNSGVGYTFASILRSLLRQDPDVILVGEIRDQETAEISIKAALTGHLVLSTLHTNSAVATISRLLNMGIAPYLISSSVTCVVAQRLVRRICPDCKKEDEACASLLETLGPSGKILEGKKLCVGAGCPSCHGSGFKGRAPLYEVLTVSDELRQMILAGASQDELKRVARLQGMKTLRHAGLDLVAEGITSLSEALGVTNEDADTSQTSSIPLLHVTATLPPPNAPQQLYSTIVTKPDSIDLQNESDIAALSPEVSAIGTDKIRDAVKRWKGAKQSRMNIM
jgi:type IV pilus assembly protein PilB